MSSHGNQDDIELQPVTRQRYAHENSFPESSGIQVAQSESPGIQVVQSESLGIQVVPDYGAQVHYQPTLPEPVTNGQPPDLSPDLSPDSHPVHPGDQHHQSQRPRWPRRKWLIFGGITFAVVVLIGVLGGVLGSRAAKKSSSTKFGISSSLSTPSSSPPSSSPSSSLTSSSSPPSSSNASSLPNAGSPVERQYNLAAVSFPTNSVDNTRLYYQDNTGEIVEAATSSKNSSWINTNLGFFAKNGSALGAAVAQPGFTHEITVLFIDAENLLHDVVYSSVTDSWVEGELSNKKYITSSDGSVAVMYYQCAVCTNTTIIAYQDDNGFVQIVNKTSTDWISTQINLNPINNTGLALQLFPQANVNLYYQESNLSLSSAWWIPSGLANRVTGWLPEAQVYNTAAPGTPIAAATSNSDAPTGNKAWIELLSVSETGLEVDTWSGLANGWIGLGNHPSSMANSTADPKAFEAVAITDSGQAFAIVSTSGGQEKSIESWRVADDLVSWMSTGTVDVGNAWD